MKSRFFHRVDRCRGMTLFRSDRVTSEIWFCPPGYEIERHSHDNEHIELIPLFGFGRFYRQPSAAQPAETVDVGPLRWFRRHTVPMGWVHWFTVGLRLPLIFVNVSRWRKGVTPTSAAHDFQPAPAGANLASVPHQPRRFRFLSLT